MLWTMQEMGDETLDSPLILLGKGGGGSRLLSFMAEDCGICLGAEVNGSGDCLDMNKPIKLAVRDKLVAPATLDAGNAARSLRQAAGSMLEKLPPEQRENWGFKLPESLFVLPELARAFPKARYAVMFRNPLSTSMRRTHITSNMESAIGRVTLPAAYDHAGVDRSRIPSDHHMVHNAYANRHQLELLLNFLSSGTVPAGRVFTCRFEKVVESPREALKDFSAWLGRPATASGLASAVDIDRSAYAMVADEVLREEVRRILKDVAARMGYEV
jgi:hypothetical protein